MQKQPTSSGNRINVVDLCKEVSKDNHQWGLQLSVDHDLDIIEKEKILTQLDIDVKKILSFNSDVTKSLEPAYIKAVREATKLFFDKPNELESITVWFESSPTLPSGMRKQEPTEYLFKVYPSTGLKGAPYQYFSLYVSGEKDSQGYQYSASIDKKIDSNRIILPGATLNKWLKLITDQDFGVDDNDSIIKELASDKEVASHMGIAGTNTISEQRERNVGGDPRTWGPGNSEMMVGGDPKTWGPGNSQVKPVLNKAQSLPLPVVGSLEKKNKN